MKRSDLAAVLAAAMFGALACGGGQSEPEVPDGEESAAESAAEDTEEWGEEAAEDTEEAAEDTEEAVEEAAEDTEDAVE